MTSVDIDAHHCRNSRLHRSLFIECVLFPGIFERRHGFDGLCRRVVAHVVATDGVGYAGCPDKALYFATPRSADGEGAQICHRLTLGMIEPVVCQFVGTLVAMMRLYRLLEETTFSQRSFAIMAVDRNDQR